MNHAVHLQGQEKMRIEALLSNNVRFSLTMDEWTSLSRTRFLNVVLQHRESEIINLGLFEIKGSADAVNLLNIVETSLKKFGIDFQKHIVCIISDGCNTMTKLGSDAKPVLQQLCFAHALQLAILDVLYEQKRKNKPKSRNQIEDYLTDDSDTETENNEDLELLLPFSLDQTDVFEHEYHNKLETMIKQVRKISKFFRCPKNDEVLQSYALEQIKTSLRLELDCKTRWSSMFSMLEKFQTTHALRKH